MKIRKYDDMKFRRDPYATLEWLGTKLSWLWKLIDRIRYGKPENKNQK